MLDVAADESEDTDVDVFVGVFGTGEIHLDAFAFMCISEEGSFSVSHRIAAACLRFATVSS